ncbi:MFS transporter [Sedimenticola selenatireducens]|uniref:MFS transporter n=1 Tax=Sedimenticola selenatireducens TaxID=191960 RepID=A0A558DPQ4_9GAMM|nr:MFS transporter [Sedimenticola selenatireducens]TVO70444.1 MFS transporter [Sedimenticola selenatireducens]TVT63021.1 MAG: MFS transporter [Sedimenticola selenatireducens]
MTSTILILLSGLSILLIGIGLLGTLLGVRATLESFNNIETGLIMAGYYAGYIAGTLLSPRIIRNVGHIRSFAAFAAAGAVSSLAFGLLIDPAAWFVLRILNGLCVVGLYMVVESWLNEQAAGPSRGRIFSFYMMSTLIALGAGQFLLMAGDTSELTLFAIAAILISLGLIPVAITRVHEPSIAPEKTSDFMGLLKSAPLGTIGALSAGLVNGAFWGMTPVFGQSLMLDESQIALIMSATIFGGAILQWPIGHLSDRFDRRSILILISFVTAIVASVSAFIVIRNYPGLILSSFIYGGLMFSLYGISVAHTYDQIEHGHELEATRALLLVYGIGAFTGPLLAGVCMEKFGPVGLSVVSATTVTLLALYGLYRVTRRAAPPLDQQTEFVPMVRTTPVALEMHPEVDASSETS